MHMHTECNNGHFVLHCEAIVKSVLALGRMLSRLLTYDFCPGLNRWVYWVKRPLASLGLAAVAALLCAVFVKPIALIAFGAVVLVLVLGYLWPSFSVRGLQCHVRFRQRHVTEDDPVSAIVRISNRWPWPVWGVALDGGFGANPNHSASGSSVALARVAGWSTSEYEWRFVPDCRGEYPLSPPRLVTGFPFGLRIASRPVVVEQSLLVWPRIIPLETLLDAAETRPSDERFSDQRIGDSGDMTGTRLFRDGDSLRRVHWAQTARQGRMIVCERQAAAQSAIRVVFDSDPRLHRGVGPDSTLEWSIRIAASVCAAYHRENALVECCFGHDVIPLQPGTLGLKWFLDTLAKWKPCNQQHDWHSPAVRGGSADHADSTSKRTDGDCDHEHASHRCRRIHHHNCGVFQLTITTDLGLGHRTEHRHVHGDQRLVILKTQAFDKPCTICGEEHLAPNRFSIVLEHPDDVVTDFRRKWRQVCHAG
jgi:uncharacterized protein (DUF58 family)